jgi:NitT/TauT family transport system substrate-binding protein
MHRRWLTQGHFKPHSRRARRSPGMRVWGVLGLVLVLASIAARPSLAQDSTLRITRPLDLVALPLIVMEREHLVERTAEAMGLGTLTVKWSAPDKTGSIEALAAGDSDLTVVDVAAFLIAADATAGTPDQVRGVGALAQRPYVLVARNPAIKTIRDFGAKDRIAVPELKVSGPALMLELAAAQEWGPEHYDKLDPLMVARPDAAAADALLSGKGDVDAHFSRSPYADDELGEPAVHRVMDSFDIGGPHSAAVLATTSRFRGANPELCKAILAALQQADDLIKKNPGEAAEIFGTLVKDQGIPLEALTDMIGDPDLAYAAAPAGVMRLADFMQRIGRLKHRPNSWQDLFVPESRDLAGN